MSTCIFDEFKGPGNTPAHFPFGIRIGSAGVGAINNIGIPGQAGFGVGICPGPLPPGMTPLDGHDVPSSDNYGNYMFSDGSQMVWMPAFYYRYGVGSNGQANNSVDIKPFAHFTDVNAAAAAGYALHRAFYDGGIQPGVFIDKYDASNNAGIFSSIRYGIPLDTDGSQSGVGAINGVGGINNYGRVQQAAKSRGQNFHSVSVFIMKALALLANAHALASTSTAFNAWYHPINNFPKGNNNNALGDVNDPDLVFRSANHPNPAFAAKALTGSANLFARTTHNGQNSGVADVNGNMYKVAFGITSDGMRYYALKPTKRMRDLTGNDATAMNSFFGAAGIAENYVDLGITVGEATASNTVKLIGSTNPVFWSDTSGTFWQATGAGIPRAVGGTNQFGNDFFVDFRPNEMCPLVSAAWALGSTAGVWALNLADVRASPDTSVGGRAALYL